jgi:hypothetical protein
MSYRFPSDDTIAPLGLARFAWDHLAALPQRSPSPRRRSRRVRSAPFGSRARPRNRPPSGWNGAGARVGTERLLVACGEKSVASRRVIEKRGGDLFDEARTKMKTAVRARCASGSISDRPAALPGTYGLNISCR